jgi:hypothetical protein
MPFGVETAFSLRNFASYILRTLRSAGVFTAKVARIRKDREEPKATASVSQSGGALIQRLSLRKVGVLQDSALNNAKNLTAESQRSHQ